jgi:hypothetical protein
MRTLQIFCENLQNVLCLSFDDQKSALQHCFSLDLSEVFHVGTVNVSVFADNGVGTDA